MSEQETQAQAQPQTSETAAQPEVEQTEKAEGKVDSVSASTASLNLDDLGNALGTKFESPDKAIESLKNLNKLVGDQSIAQQRKAAERYEKVLENVAPDAKSQGFDDPDEYVDFLLSSRGAEQPNPAEWRNQKAEMQEKKQGEKIQSEVEALKEELQKTKFERKFGEEAVKYWDAVKAMASAQNSTDMFATYETSPFKDVVEADRDKKATSVIEDNSRVKSSASELEKEFKQAEKTGDWSGYIAKKTGVKF